MFSLLQRFPTFRHGVHPPESKTTTCRSKIRQFPFAPVLVIPLSQHIGAPAVAVVREGQEVERGQVLARADGFVSVAQHAPASGVVRRLGLVPSIAGKMTPGIHLEPYRERWAAYAPVYLIGITGAYWVIERVGAMAGPA